MYPMASSLHAQLTLLRMSARTEREKGRLFEQLMAAFLRTEPQYAEMFDQVWLWEEWPDRPGPDCGIDIVASLADGSGLAAIQCKFYDPDHQVSKRDVDTFLAESGRHKFAWRLIVATTDKWNSNADKTIADQQIPVGRLGLAELEEFRTDWAQLDWGQPERLELSTIKSLRKHQHEAIDAVMKGLAEHDRGKLVMACGTGKTFTSLKLVEKMVGAGGSVLFLVPSISLLSQTYREWMAESAVPINAVPVCSDGKATSGGRKASRANRASEEMTATDLAVPVSTDSDRIAAKLRVGSESVKSMTVVFSTYQSIEAVRQAQHAAGLTFDLIVCDEAHRTTGVTLAGEDESAFVQVHDNVKVPAHKRLYMTATPRIYADGGKTKAEEAAAVVASMDDEAVYGPELYRLSFGAAVGKGLLTDYKVLVLAVNEETVARVFQTQLSAGDELKLDDAARLVGCWKGLQKQGQSEHDFEDDPYPMKRAVAFAGTIAASKQVAKKFVEVGAAFSDYVSEDGDDSMPTLLEEPASEFAIRHVDGSMNSLYRGEQLQWLKDEPSNGECRILTNARCLSEGVDVPSLDAVMFLSPRKSQVDIIQSVGRVMRLAPEKKLGYIILPIGVPAGATPEEVLSKNKTYDVVWDVLNALRAHDERFDAMVNRIDLNKSRDPKIDVIGVGFDDPDNVSDGNSTSSETATALTLFDLEGLRDGLYAKIVKKVGTRRYWEQWATDVADIAERHITRMTALLNDPSLEVREEFETFVAALRDNLNDGISDHDAIEMLAQHLITRPVFDALFEGYQFTEHNPVAQVMERMLGALDRHALDAENETLQKFYTQVRMRAAGIDNAEGRQRVIVELYDKFFRHAFKRVSEKLGIVYTPVEVVDFILRSADWALKEATGRGLSDEGVHVLDGFTGTGTFIVRLLQLGLIDPKDLQRKYRKELHANEILLLAYYIAAVNIESTYRDVRAQNGVEESHETFPGLVSNRHAPKLRGR